MQLSKLDPNLVLTLVTLAGSLVTWLYHKAKGDKQADITDALWAALEGKVIALAESEEVASVIRSKLIVAANEALARMGIKSNAVTDAILLKLVERGVTEVRKRVIAKKTARELDSMLSSAAAVRFDKPSGATIPKLDIDVEIAKPEVATP
jgi:hypothetical protein